MAAYDPFGGHYDVMPSVWAAAHTTQFTAPGWRLLKLGHGSGKLEKGGTYVGYANVVGGATSDVTIVIEKMDRNQSLCQRGEGLTELTDAETATFTLPPLVFPGDDSKTMQLWVSHFGKNETGSTTLFQKQPAVPVVDGKVTLLVEPNHVYTLSTVTTAGHGETAPPQLGSFPSNYRDDFDDCIQASIPKYVAPMSGAFECVAQGSGGSGGSNGGGGMTVRQMAPALPICDRGDVTPYAIIGDGFRRTYNVTIDILLPADTADTAAGGGGGGGGGFVGARAKGPVGSGTGMDGVFLAINQTSWWVGLKVVAVSGGSGLNGTAMPPSVLASGVLPARGSSSSVAGGWRTVSLAVEGTRARGTVDGKVLFENMAVPAPHDHYTAKVAGDTVDLGAGGYAAFGTVGYAAGVEFDQLVVVSK